MFEFSNHRSISSRQLFNVKQAILSWLSGSSPNLGLLVTATTIFGERVTVDFARRDEQPRDKQPILVLFNGDAPPPSRYPVDAIQEEDRDEVDEEMDSQRTRNRRHEGQPEVAPDYEAGNRPDKFVREKKPRRQMRQRDENGVARPRKAQGE